METMPSPEELKKIQEQQLTKKQIKDDTIREEAFLVGMEKGEQNIVDEHARNIINMLKEKGIKRNDGVKIGLLNGSSKHGVRFIKIDYETNELEYLQQLPGYSTDQKNMYMGKTIVIPKGKHVDVIKRGRVKLKDIGTIETCDDYVISDVKEGLREYEKLKKGDLYKKYYDYKDGEF